MSTNDEPLTQLAIDNWFSYHPPTEGGNQAARYTALRAGAKQFAEQIVAMCPNTSDRNAALQKLREVVFTANASIACGEVGTNGLREV